MNAAFQRGMVLFSQNRYDLADREFRQELAEEPENPFAHAFLALCLTQRNQPGEALREADEAVRLAPDLPFAHYVRGQVLLDQKRPKAAEEAATEAIRLDPSSADHYDLMARVHLTRRNWTEALAAAEQGLALDAEHAGCTNLRAMALVNLGRKDEANRTLHSALANDPENSLTHANQGWALLHQGDHVKALDHFREALRIDPENEWARIGIIESLKARYLVYRLLLRFSLWMSRQSTAARWVFIFGIIFVQRLLARAADKNPAFLLLIVLIFGFLLMTWIASPLFNLLLRLNKFGRLALSPEQRTESSWIGGFFALATLGFVTSVIHPTDLSVFGMFYCGLLLLPLAVTFNQPSGRSRRRMAAVTGVIALLGLPYLAFLLLGPSSPLGNEQQAIEYFHYFCDGAILSSWVPALIGLREAEA
jgi:tetratricopeptide (TPR) repeat protein